MRINLTWSRISVLFVVFLIFLGSSIPSKSIPGIFQLTPDKLIHCLEYAVLGLFLFRWLRLEYPSFSLTRINAITFFLGSLTGILDENYQRLTPGRSPNFWDWVLDSVGVILVIVLMNYLNRIKSSK